MAKRLFRQLEAKQEKIRELSERHERLEDEVFKKMGELVGLEFLLNENKDELKLAREEEDNIQKDIDSLLGAE